MNGAALITGGAGFIGTNVAHRLLTSGKPVLLFDNLSRPGSRQNYEWLRRMHGNLVRLQVGDIRDRQPFGPVGDLLDHVAGLHKPFL